METYTKKVETINDYLDFFTQLSFSKSYTIYANQYVAGVSLEKQQIEHQVYEQINGQHLYTITNFLQEEKKENASIILELKNCKIEYLF